MGAGLRKSVFDVPPSTIEDVQHGQCIKNGTGSTMIGQEMYMHVISYNVQENLPHMEK